MHEIQAGRIFEFQQVYFTDLFDSFLDNTKKDAELSNKQRE